MDSSADTARSGVAGALYGSRRGLAFLATDLLPLADFAAVATAALASRVLYGEWIAAGGEVWANSGAQVLVAAGLAAFLLYDKNFGSLVMQGRRGELLRSFAAGVLKLAAILLAIRFASGSFIELPHGLVALWFFSSVLLTLGARTALARALRPPDQPLTETIAIVGSGPLAERLAARLRAGEAGGADVLGVFDEGGGAARDLDELLRLGHARRIDWILMTLADRRADQLPALLQRLEPLRVPIGFCPDNVGMDLPYRGVDYVVEGLPVTLLADRPIRRWNAVLKSAEDLVLAGFATLLLLPLLGLIALAIKLESPGPVIFKQRRHAWNNSEFFIYKFRTMREDAQGPADVLQQTRRADPRVTRVGRFLRTWSLDELPQLFNVLAGDMSLVGPRPHAVNMRTEDRLGHEIIDVYPHRHRVKPGITGWAQVNGARGATDTAEQLRRRIQLDLEYVENWSLWLDLRILLLTLREVIRRTNAY